MIDLEHLTSAIDEERRYQAGELDHNLVQTRETRRLILDAAERAETLDRTFDLRWSADMRAIKRWQERTGRTLTHPDHADLVVWLLDERDAEKRKAWWGGAMWGIVLAAVIVFIAWGPI